MAKEIKIEKHGDPRDMRIAENNRNPEKEAVEKKPKNVEESIRARYGNIKPGEFVGGQVPVGTKFNGIEAVKPQTDLDNYQEYPCTEKVCKTAGERILHRYQEECKRDEIKREYDDALLSEQDEKKVKHILDKKLEETKAEMPQYAKERLERLQNFIGKRLNKEDIIELFEKLDELEKEYVPEENIDKSYKVNDKELIEKASKLYEALPDKNMLHLKETKKNNDEAVPGDFDGICRDLMALHARKNHDYGNAAHESYKEFGLVSYIIRLNDKMNRLKSLTKPGIAQKVTSESIEDTLMDLAAYAIMAIESLRS